MDQFSEAIWCFFGKWMTLVVEYACFLCEGGDIEDPETRGHVVLTDGSAVVFLFKYMEQRGLVALVHPRSARHEIDVLSPPRHQQVEEIYPRHLSKEKAKVTSSGLLKKRQLQSKNPLRPFMQDGQGQAISSQYMRLGAALTVRSLPLSTTGVLRIQSKRGNFEPP